MKKTNSVTKNQTSLFSFFKKQASDATKQDVAVVDLASKPSPMQICNPVGKELIDHQASTPSAVPAAANTVQNQPKRKTIIEDEDSDDDIIVKPAAAKRAKVESEEEWDSESSASTASSDSYADEEEEEVKPAKKSAPKKTAAVFSTPKTPKKVAPSPADITYSASPVCRDASSDEYLTALSTDAPATGVYAYGQHEHHSWEFFKHPRDASGIAKGHPGYNPRTWQVPDKVLRDQTPAMRQWFEMKMNNFDVVLFFKVGKFYELFHMDADVGMRELDLIYMKGTKGHSGFPEVSYGKYASILVSKGYRVARIEQTETPDMLKERNKTAKKGTAAKVVSREMCSVMSKGTRTFCHMDDMSLVEEHDSLLMCLLEREGVYGVCLVNTILCTVTFSQFEDTSQRTRLRTLLSQYRPSEIVLAHGMFSDETMGVIKLLAESAVMEYLQPKELYSCMKLQSLIREQHYFTTTPEIIEKIQCDEMELVFRAFGGAIWLLQRALIDFETISHGRYQTYNPPDVVSAMGEVDSSEQWTGVNKITEPPTSHMILDAIALANLEILANTYDHSEKGSLWEFINHCSTAYGQRLLREWVCKPLLCPSKIQLRREAVNDLLLHSKQAEQMRNTLKNTPDLERLLSRVHSNAINRKSINHPESRAIMYEDAVYSNRKIKDFIDILHGFEAYVNLGRIFQGIETTSHLLQRITKNSFPSKEMATSLQYFRSIFDEKQAKRDGFIKPLPGVNINYDNAKHEIQELEAKFESYLKEQKTALGIHDLKYFGSNKDRYQLEVPMGQVGKVPVHWASKSQKKTHRRYWNKFIEENLAMLTAAEERLAEAQKDTLRSIFEKFDANRTIWSAAVSCVMVLDALLSLAEISAFPQYTWPEIIAKTDVPVLDIKGGRHPMLEKIIARRGDASFIANNVKLGGTSALDGATEFTPKFLILSGPNMGGKSTFLRQTCLIAIMAQLGCKVPADSCVMTPVDRVFTRVGASDKILAGQSTFFVELAETAMMLKHATEDSICILDELGRGTATFDGTAIAHAVVEHLTSVTRCRTLFATHYHSLVNDWSADPRVTLGHMDCIVNVEEGAVCEEVTFLYRLTAGSSPRSYGLNVAKLARLPVEVLQLAQKRSAEFEEKMRGKNAQERDPAIMRQFFERLCSIVSADMSIDELKWTAGELWRRFRHVMSL